ncbi:hypothetical protein ACHAXR_004728 [Thalassiosira sp. AJA248-18]
MADEAEDSPTPLRIGILGAARISRKIIAAIQHETSGCEVIAVASRSATKATDLIRDHVIKKNRHKVKVFSGTNAYHDLIAASSNDSDVIIDALYIPLPTTLKKEWTTRALRSGMHVLIEKPVAPSAADYQEMIQEAKLHNRYLMDGTMFVHHPRTERLLAEISSEDTFGKVACINAAFTILGNDDFMKNNIRMKRDCDFQGCIGDLGWYCIRLAQLVFRRVGFGSIKSAQVSDWKLNEEGVPIDATCLVTFQADDNDDECSNTNSNHTLSFHCSYLHPWNQIGEVFGTKQAAKVMGFVNPKEGPVSFQVCASNEDFNMANQPSPGQIGERADVEHMVPCEVSQITLMWIKFREYCKVVEERGWNDEDTITPTGDDASALSEISLENQLVVDALMESIGGNGKIVCLPLK